MNPLISSIQQVGLGVKDVSKAWKWYRKMFGMDVPVFDDRSEAALMVNYTGGTVQTRHAVMALNMAGGGGLEIWQFTSRKPTPQPSEPEPGDLGIFAVRFKSLDVARAHAWMREQPDVTLSPLYDLPEGKGFWGKDPFGNTFQLAEDSSWFDAQNQLTGGVAGVAIGVSDMERALPFYQKLLAPCEVVYDQTGTFDDLPSKDSTHRYRRVLLRKQVSALGAFSTLLGNCQVELFQALDRSPRTLFEQRYWGDCGYIHVCFDTLDMDALKARLQDAGYLFTVDSEKSFGMESAAGRFAYVEDPDGTLIELVETHKLPILKKLGWYIDLQKRKKQKPLPKWMLKTMRFNRVKD